MKSLNKYFIQVIPLFLVILFFELIACSDSKSSTDITDPGGSFFNSSSSQSTNPLSSSNVVDKNTFSCTIIDDDEKICLEYVDISNTPYSIDWFVESCNMDNGISSYLKCDSGANLSCPMQKYRMEVMIHLYHEFYSLFTCEDFDFVDE